MADSTLPRFVPIDRLPGVPDAGLCYCVRDVSPPAPRVGLCVFYDDGTSCYCQTNINEPLSGSDWHVPCCECNRYPRSLHDSLPVVRDHGALIAELPASAIRAGALFADVFGEGVAQ